MTKQKTKHVSARIKPELRDAMQRWADDNSMPISWVVGRVIELGFPAFTKNPLPSKRRAEAAA